MDKIIIGSFKNKCKEIYKAEKGKVNKCIKYWFVVEDVYAKEAEMCYSIYYDLLGQLKGGEYFEVFVVSKDEMNNLRFLKPKKIY